MTPVPGKKALDPAAALGEAAAANPELRRLLAERDMLVQRMQEIAERSPGAFAGHDQARFPVEPLGERRARDDRWAQARDDSRSAAIRRILDSRRREAAAEADRWSERRDQQRVRASDDVRAEREAAEAQARALDARIEQARRDLLAERWAARPAEPDEGWHALRERRAVEALAEARARAGEAAAREQALERRFASERARRPEAWSDEREQRRARALELARRQTVEAAAAEQALDRRVARAREERLRENRAAQDAERPPQWTLPSERRDPDPLPPEPARWLPRTAAERSLDERIARARTAELRESRPRAESAERPTPREEASVPVRAPRQGDDAERRYPGRHDERPRAEPRAAAPPLRERGTPEPVMRAERPEPGLPPRPQRELESFERRRDRQREARAAPPTAGRDRATPPPDRPARETGIAGHTPRRADRPSRTSPDRSRGGGETMHAWEERRERARLNRAAGARRLGPPGERRPARPARPSGRPLAPHDTASGPRPEGLEQKAAEEEREKPPRSKDAAERGQDLDKRREQALERLKARRESERRDERRRALSLDRLASMRGRFGGLGR
jgi:hypothetical protein